MAQTGYTAKAVLNFVGGSQAMPALAGRWLGLLTTAPTDADASSVEVSGGSYARVQVAGTLAATASWTTATPNITMTSNPGWVVPGMTVYDATNSNVIGTVSTYSGTALVLTSNAAHASTGSTDNLNFSIWPAATSAGPATATSNAVATFAQATVSWGTVVAWGIYDAVSSGNLLEWDWLGNDPWFPCTMTSASPGVVTAIGITSGSSPTLANSASVVFTARFGGALPAALTAETVYTVAGLSADTFNVSVNTAGTSSMMVRQITQQPIAINVTASFASGALILAAA